MAKLELKNLRKQFAPSVVPVKDITIEVEDGEFLTLLGPSGCGKSTLLRLIAGLEQPTQGKVTIGGKNVTSVPPGKRNISMVFQSYALYPHMTVFENISAALKLRKIPKNEIEKRVNDVTQKLGLEHLLTRKPGQLSGGQRQRVALARSLVRDPDIFLLDEPLSNLDALLREQVRADLKQLFETQNKPVVYVTHDQIEAMTLSDKIAVLCDGYLQQLASPHEIYTAPANKFVAGFVGSPQMNLLTLNCQENKAILGDYKIIFPQLKTKANQVILGIRPEDISLGDIESGQTIAGHLFLVEDFGKEKLLSVRVNGSDQTLRVMVPADRTWEGEIITISLIKKQLHWFDVETGDRLN
ncbi:ABC transporter ATP-binding protein [Capilliphycus salinus ALCB114379]|uniref:ABC transporter ATP-binding protein n=1 Tax=Capilliphycus salinus TaxID=2768948 RepID=UPI0039A5A9FE